MLPINKCLKVNVIICLVLSGYEENCHAGNDNDVLGARSAGVSSASVAFTDFGSSVNNQAGLAYVDRPSAAFYYENRFNVRYLSIQSGAIAVPVKKTVIGFNYCYSGYSKYNESSFGLALGKKLFDRLALGIQMNYLQSHFEGYGNFGNLCAEIGLLCEPVSHLMIGMHLFNPTLSRQKADPNEKIPTIIRFGIGYTIREKAIITIETEKDLLMQPVFKAGLELNLVKGLSIRCGLSSSGAYQYSFGLGYMWKRFVIDMAFSNHKYMGYSPHVSIAVSL